MKINYFIIVFLLAFQCSCSVRTDSSKSKMNFSNNTWRTDQPPSIGEITKAVNENEVNEKLEGMKNWWLYGPGMGRTILNVGTTIVFPPYALYLITNAGLSISGYEAIKPTEILPDEPKEVVDEAYNDITSIPGRLSAYLNNRDYIEQIPEGLNK